jgi:hypothetical protein
LIRRVTADMAAGALVLAVALVARLLPVFVFPSINYPDEMFQTLEQARTGSSLVPASYRGNSFTAQDRGFCQARSPA